MCAPLPPLYYVRTVMEDWVDAKVIISYPPQNHHWAGLVQGCACAELAHPR